MGQIDIDAPGTSQLLLGNEAIARGALEAGIGFAASYPGTPSTEIVDSLALVAKKLGIYVEWSVNEIVALEAATGASLTGIRALAAMKHDGVNVSMDCLSKLATIGIGKGGLVLITADDPSAISSSREQDLRVAAKWFDIPTMEPSDPQEAKDMMKCLFDFSEEWGTVCMLRSVTRVSHSRGNVKFGELKKNERKAYFPDVHDTHNPSPSWFVPFPPDVKFAAHQKILEKVRKQIESSEFNNYEGPKDADSLIVTSGNGYLYAKEAVRILKLESKVGILKIGIVWPLPVKLISKHLKKAGKVLVVEEISAFVEEHLMAMAGTFPPAAPRPVFYGRHSGNIGLWGELNPDIVIKALADMVGVKYRSRDIAYSKKAEPLKAYVPERPVSICPGCPHRASLWTIKRALKIDGRNGLLTGDIGCYFTGFNPSGFCQIRTGYCMGAGLGVANGLGKMKQYGFDQPVLASCGDSTFFHASIPALINSVWNESNFVACIMDNSATAMTGFQPHPGSGMNAMREPVEPISIEAICHSLGIRVEVCDPFDLDNTTATLLDLINDERRGSRVIILRRECELIRARRDKQPPFKVYVDIVKCIGESCGCDRLCNRAFTCPAISWDKEAGKARIDEVICSGCGFCASLCPQGAIIKEVM